MFTILKVKVEDIFHIYPHSQIDILLEKIYGGQNDNQPPGIVNHTLCLSRHILESIIYIYILK